MEKADNLAVVLSGGFCDAEKLKPRLDGIIDDYGRENMFVIAADSGIKYASPLGLEADTIVGDYDSIEDRSLIPGKCEVITVPCEKDDTDTTLAAKIAASRGYGRIIICGGFGGRIDHFLSNLYYLEMLDSIGCTPLLTDGSNFITVINGTDMEIDGGCRYFSLLSLDDMCHITITGAKYDVCDAALTRMIPYAVSNEPQNGGNVHIGTDGKLIVTMYFE